MIGSYLQSDWGDFHEAAMRRISGDIIFTGNMELAKKIGLQKPAEESSCWNGNEN